MSKESEEYRLKMPRRLKDENSSAPPPEVLEAEKVIAKYREEQEQINATKMRLRLQLPNTDLCPQCFYSHGNRSLMQPKPAGGRPIDMFECEKCGYLQERDPHP